MKQKCIVISTPYTFSGEARLLSELLDWFDITLHLRKPAASKEELISLLQEIPGANHSCIVLHSHWEVEEKFQIKGLHFSTKNREKALEFSSRKMLSTSCHSFDECLHLPPHFSSCFLSPVFKSISKQGYGSGMDLVQLKKDLEKPRNVEVIALGGIEAENLQKLEYLNFNGYALLGTVWGKS